MGLVEIDPLAVLPVRAASASAAFARACDPSRDSAERCEHLRSLELALLSLRDLLDRCEQATGRLAAEVPNPTRTTDCTGPWRDCRQCVEGGPGSSAGVWHHLHFGRDAEPPGSGHCGQPAEVTMQDVAGRQRLLCLSHAADAVRERDHVSIVAASRCSRAVLGEVANETSVISRRPGRTDAQGHGCRA
jgi:hypothetical protein